MNLLVTFDLVKVKFFAHFADHLAFSRLFLLNVKNTQFCCYHVYFRYHECNVPYTTITVQSPKKKLINEEKIGQDTQNVKILISSQFLQEITPISNVILDWMTVTSRPKSNEYLSTNKGGSRRPEKSRKWESVFSVHVLLCVLLMMSGWLLVCF